MGSAQRYGFLVANFLILTLLADSTAACYCTGWQVPLPRIYCASDVVIKGEFVNAVIGDPEWYWARYDFKLTRTFKAPSGSVNLQALYTQLQGSTCGYRHNGPFDNTEFIVTGKMRDNRVVIDVCSFIKPVINLTREELQSLLLNYPDDLVECLNMRIVF
ncbi:metalloproteinase inhibitor 1-like [Paroedura picta]|uniref:metalloproteinase inhibitor 1-like n=1 Tax=Paroedura picta TaxID=143630 RepID=UPI004056E2C0